MYRYGTGFKGPFVLFIVFVLRLESCDWIAIAELLTCRLTVCLLYFILDQHLCVFHQKSILSENFVFFVRNKAIALRGENEGVKHNKGLKWKMLFSF
jgi:hypothetical protein